MSMRLTRKRNIREKVKVQEELGERVLDALKGIAIGERGLDVVKDREIGEGKKGKRIYGVRLTSGIFGDRYQERRGGFGEILNHER
jgi:hypothetical protein